MAQLDASLILAGRPLDVVGAMRQGNAAAMETNALRQNNQLAELYRQQGAGLLAGDQGAFNALAGIAPDQAFNMRGAQQDFQMNARKMEILNAEEKRLLEDRAATMSAVERAEAAKKIEDAVKMGLAIQSPEQWDAMMAQNSPELVGQFGNRQALAMKYMSVAEVFKLAQGPEPVSTEGKLSQDMRNGLIEPGAMPNEPPKTLNVKLADGSDAVVQWNPATRAWDPAPIPAGGASGQPKDKLTESQSKITLFQTLQSETSPVLSQIEQLWDPANIPDAAARSTPIAGNFFQSQQGQIYGAAAAAWAEGALRIATGAAATDPEIKRTVRTYFAQPGDTPQTVQFKNQMRAMYERAIQRALGARTVDGKLALPADFASSIVTDAAPPPPPGGPIVTDDGYTIEAID